MTSPLHRPERRGAPFIVWCALIVLGQTLSLLGAESAQAHPFGPPQTAAVDLAPDGSDRVRVRWRVGGEDDLVLLGVDLGVLPPDRVLQDGATFYRPEDGTALMRDTRFADYLSDTVRVSDGAGGACRGRLSPLSAGERLEVHGVTMLFGCPGDPTRPTVTLSTLTDLHPAYRTLASGPDGQRAVYTRQAPEHGWQVTRSDEVPGAVTGDAEHGSTPPAATAAPARSAAWQLGGLGAGALLLVGVGLRVARSRRTHAD